jgi:hypothetical protein
MAAKGSGEAMETSARHRGYCLAAEVPLVVLGLFEKLTKL